MGVSFRMKDTNNQYFHFLHKMKALGYDCYGNVLSIIGVFTDMEVWQGSHEIRLSVDGPKIHFSKTYEQKTREKNNKIKFSKRESQILTLISMGHSSRAIAEKLFISIHTVNAHRRNMLEKIGGHNTAALINYALKCGVL